MEKFKYCNSLRIVNWGLGFDSILELKFAISIHAEYEFMRGAVSLFYDPATKRLLKRPVGNARRYTPDFLIRHRHSKKASWIEIKPEKFTDNNTLCLKEQLAKRYIEVNRLDWEYKVVRGDQIHLSTNQVVQFNECCSCLFAGKKILPEMNPFGRCQTSSQVHFVMYGVDRHKSFWKR